MARPPKSSRPAAEADLLTSLPARLLDEILSRLDLPDAVRTSALSRSWRHRWESVPALALSFPEGAPPRAVDSVLIRYSGPHISRFAFGGDRSSACRISDWLIALSRRSVESISIGTTRNSGSFHMLLHSSIFSCAHLVSLDISSCEMPSLPVGFAGFPVLQELKLNSVGVFFHLNPFIPFPENMENPLETIIRGSPLLRVLSLWKVTLPEGCVSVIEASNLRTLKISSIYDVWRFGELPCLEDANIDVSEYNQFPHGFRQFLVGISHVRELSLSLQNLESYLKMPSTRPFIFYNLKSLKLSACFNNLFRISLIFYVLRMSPNVEKLEIKIHIDDEDEENKIASQKFLNARWTDGMCANLEVVQIINVNRFPNEISFMKLILSKARLLRILSVDDFPKSSDDPLNELRKCRRASAISQVLFKESEETTADDESLGSTS